MEEPKFVTTYRDWLERKLGDEGRAKAALIGTGVAIAVVPVLALGVGLGAMPMTAGPGAASSEPPVSIGSGVSSKDRGEQASEEQMSAGVPDEAKTVRELSESRIVKARVTGVAGPCSFICELPNGESVTVRLLDVEAGEKNDLVEGGALPYELVRDDRPIWLERATRTADADGVWPRYLWMSDPKTPGINVPDSLYNVKQSRYDVRVFAYKPEEGANVYAEQFKSVAQDPAVVEAERQAEIEAKQKEEWERRRKEQEAKEQKAHDSDISRLD